jgi:hypothetical protein
MLNFIKDIFSPKKSAISTAHFTASVDNEMKSVDELIQLWRQTNLRLNVPASMVLIVNAQHELGFAFPEDFIHFYQQVNGFKDWDVIGEMFSIWPLEKIVEEYKASESKKFIAFCDYLIDSHRIGYFKNKPGVFKDYDKFNLVANSFDETISLIIAGSDRLY